MRWGWRCWSARKCPRRWHRTRGSDTPIHPTADGGAVDGWCVSAAPYRRLRRRTWRGCWWRRSFPSLAPHLDGGSFTRLSIRCGFLSGSGGFCVRIRIVLDAERDCGLVRLANVAFAHAVKSIVDRVTAQILLPSELSDADAVGAEELSGFLRCAQLLLASPLYRHT